MAKTERAVAPVVQDQSVLHVNRVEEIRAKADRDCDESGHRSGRSISKNLAAVQDGGVQESQIVRRREEGVRVVVTAHPPHHRLRMVERQTDAEDVLFGRRTLEPTLHVWDVIQVDVQSRLESAPTEEI